MQAAQGLCEGALGCLGGWGSLELSCGVALLPGLRASQNIPTPNSIALLPMLAKNEDQGAATAELPSHPPPCLLRSNTCQALYLFVNLSRF